MSGRGLKIAMVTPQWLKTKGGPSTYVDNLSQELRRGGHEVTVYSSEGGEGATAFRGGLVPSTLELFRLLCAAKPDVVHIHGRVHYGMPALLYRMLSNRRAKVVLSLHTMPYVKDYLPTSEKNPPEYAGLRKVIVRAVLRGCNAVTTVADSIVLDLNRFYRMGIRRYSVVHSASRPRIADASAVDEMRERYGLNDRYPVLCTVGVFSWDWKALGHRISMEAVDALRQRYPKIRLLIAGDGKHRPYLENFIRERGLENHVTLLGNIDCIDEFLALPDIYVHMALNEACPLAVIEAMRTGKPIVAARRGGIPEIIDDGVTGALIESQVPMPQPTSTTDLGCTSSRTIGTTTSADPLESSRYEE